MYLFPAFHLHCFPHELPLVIQELIKYITICFRRIDGGSGRRAGGGGSGRGAGRGIKVSGLSKYLPAMKAVTATLMNLVL